MLEWFNEDCPYVQRHHEKEQTMEKLAAKYADKDVVWLAVNSTNGKTNETNKAANAKTVALLGVTAGNHVLEIGFGNGRTVPSVIAQAADVHRNRAAKVPFNAEFALEDLSQLGDVSLGEVPHAHVRSDLRLVQNLFARGEADHPIAYLAAQPDLGILKATRPKHARDRLDALPPEPKL